MKWFGEGWGAVVNDEKDKTATPLGDKCVDCGMEIQQGQHGFVVPFAREDEVTVAVFHHWCFLLGIVGPDTILPIFGFGRMQAALDARPVQHWKEVPCGCRVDQGGGIEFCAAHMWWTDHGHDHGGGEHKPAPSPDQGADRRVGG